MGVRGFGGGMNITWYYMYFPIHLSFFLNSRVRLIRQNSTQPMLYEYNRLVVSIANGGLFAL